MMHELHTWKDLLDFLQACPPEVLTAHRPQVHFSNPNGDAPQVFDTILAIGTVGTLFDTGDHTVDAWDGGHHPDRLVLLADCNYHDLRPRSLFNEKG